MLPQKSFSRDEQQVGDSRLEQLAMKPRVALLLECRTGFGGRIQPVGCSQSSEAVGKLYTMRLILMLVLISAVSQVSNYFIS